MMTDTPAPPPPLLKKFSAQAREESYKRNGPGYLKTFAMLCIDWASSQSTSNLSQIRSSSINPPSELVRKWCEQLFGCPDEPEVNAYELARLAAQWGADQELEACIEWLDMSLPGYDAGEESLLAARRHKSPSLKQQALELMQTHGAAALKLDPGQCETIRRALEELPDD